MHLSAEASAKFYKRVKNKLFTITAFSAQLYSAKTCLRQTDFPLKTRSVSQNEQAGDRGALPEDLLLRLSVRHHRPHLEPHRRSEVELLIHLRHRDPNGP